MQHVKDGKMSLNCVTAAFVHVCVWFYKGQNLQNIMNE